MKKVGTVTICENDKTRQIALTNMVRCEFNDHRLCTVAKTEEDTFVLAVENPPSSGRNVQSQIHLSEDSMLGLIATALSYYIHQGVDINKKMVELINSEDIELEYNDGKEE